MYQTLKKIKAEDKVADYLFPGLPDNIKGKICSLSNTRIVIEADINGEIFEFITHPNNIYIIQKKA